MEKSLKISEGNNSSQKMQVFQRLLPYIGIVVVVLLFGILTDFRSLTFRNIRLIIEQSCVLFICATGVFFIMTMGGLDFSQGSIIGVASIAVAYFAQYNFLLAVISGMFVGLFIGAINGILHVKFKIGSFIVTICTMFIFRGVCAFLTTAKPMSAPIFMYSFNKWYYLISAAVLVLVLGAFFFSMTSFGRKLKAIGAGETAARFSGVKVAKIKFLVFMLAGILTGFAATINTIRVGSITASSGTLLETNIMISLVLGGMPVSGGAKNRFSSVLVGVLLFAILNNGLVMLQINPNVQQLIRGLVFLVIVVANTDRDAVLIIK
ncbi:MAG: ABC transporter permease [Spirochaetales bacterium]|uniref:Autoinducer 2 import system permease protein LsrC n=1 Tax=Candidatus Thalassospirochaeta sargassi TaxID=3119039 RepID=A0AAJ1MKI7_9SPIO|nr:ABC transporter permease [Spirochaetales bacterium]